MPTLGLSGIPVLSLIDGITIHIGIIGMIICNTGWFIN